MGLFKDIHFCFGNGNSRKELDVDKFKAVMLSIEIIHQTY